MRKVTAITLICVGLLISLSACGHTHTWIEATCTAAKTCSDCGETEGEPIGHSWIEATCTEAKTCSVCNETEGDPLGHSWIEATCTEPKTCSVCSETEGEPLEHTVENWNIEKEPTCSAEGTESGICSRCKDTVQRPIAKLAHSPGEWTVTRNATAKSAGERTQNCAVCGEILGTEEFTLSAEEIEAQYKASCVTYSYDTIARDPEKYKNTYAKYKGEIIQVIEDGNTVQLRVNITKGRYTYSDTIYVAYVMKDGESRLLEDDIVTIYGMNMGTISYESVLGATITIPCVYAEYIDLQ